MIKQSSYQAGEGRFCIKMFVSETDEGLVAQLFGGEKPHVGAMVLSVPAPGMINPGAITCTTVVVPLLGHKDDHVAKLAAEQIARAAGVPVVVVAGVHVDDAGEKEIKELVNNCQVVTRALLKDLQAAK